MILPSLLRRTILTIVALGTAVTVGSAAEPSSSGPRATLPAVTTARAVEPEEMKRIHDEIATPFKYGIVVPREDGEMIDCSNVFRHNGRWDRCFFRSREKSAIRQCLRAATISCIGSSSAPSSPTPRAKTGTVGRRTGGFRSTTRLGVATTNPDPRRKILALLHRRRAPRLRD